MNKSNFQDTLTKTKVVTEGYKKNSLGDIPYDWEIKKLGDLGEIINGLTYSPNEISDDGILVLRSSNIKDRQLAYTDNVFVKADNYNPVKKGDILICVRNGSKSLIGKNALITKEAEGYAFGAFMAVYRSDYNNYLYQIFGTDLFQKEIHKNLGATINSINGSDLKLFKFPIPLQPEQQKIVEILSTWDDAIATCKKTIDTLKDRNKGLLQQLLTGKKRLSGFNDTWEETLLKKIIIEHKVKSSTENQYEVLTSSKKGLIKQSEYYNKGRIIDKENKGFNVIPQGYITYRSRSDDSIFTFNQNKFNFTGIVSTYYPVFEFKNCNNNYLVKLLNLNSHKIGRYSVGTSQLVLSLNELKQIKLSFPEIKEQKAIVEVLDIAEKELNSYETKLEALQLQKKGLMQQLLTGKIRVNL